MRQQVSPTIADALVVAAWVALAADSMRYAWRERGRRAELGPSIARGWQPPVWVRIVWLAATVGGIMLVERAASRMKFHPLLAIVG